MCHKRQAPETRRCCIAYYPCQVRLLYTGGIRSSAVVLVVQNNAHVKSGERQRSTSSRAASTGDDLQLGGSIFPPPTVAPPLPRSRFHWSVC